MKILLSNDDGIQAPGLEALLKALTLRHEVIVAAPAKQQSAMAHALSVQTKLYVDNYAPFQEKYGVVALQIAGTPTDCVKLYLEGIADEMPDLVLSGINNGSNLGTDILYSGTLGAALEGHIHGIPAIAVSLDYKPEITFDFVAKEINKNLKKLLSLSDTPQLLNINFPKKLRDGYQWIWAEQGIRDYANAFKPHRDIDGRRFYFVGGEVMQQDNTPCSDIVLQEQGNITVTPIRRFWDDKVFLGNKLGKQVF